MKSIIGAIALMAILVIGMPMILVVSLNGLLDLGIVLSVRTWISALGIIAALTAIYLR